MAELPTGITTALPVQAPTGDQAIYPMIPFGLGGWILRDPFAGFGTNPSGGYFEDGFGSFGHQLLSFSDLNSAGYGDFLTVITNAGEMNIPVLWNISSGSLSVINQGMYLTWFMDHAYEYLREGTIGQMNLDYNALGSDAGQWITNFMMGNGWAYIQSQYPEANVRWNRSAWQTFFNGNYQSWQTPPPLAE